MDRFDVPLPLHADVAYAVYVDFRTVAPPSRDEVRAAIGAWIGAHVPKPLRFAIDEYRSRGLILHNIAERDAFAAPPLEHLDRMRPSEAARARFVGASHVVYVAAADELAAPGEAPVGLWAAHAAAMGLAARLGGVVLDPARGHLLEPDLADRDLPADGRIAIARHITVGVIPDAAGSSLHTAGMTKFGLPEVAVARVPADRHEEGVALANAVGQALVDLLREPGTITDRGGLTLSVPAELDLDAALVARAFDSPPAARATGFAGRATVAIAMHEGAIDVDLGASPLGTLEALMGKRSTLEERRATARQALREAHERARAGWPTAKARFLAGLGPEWDFCVKVGFALGDGRVEYMWVEVDNIDGERIAGRLASAPAWRTDMQEGADVALDEGDVFDWLVASPDGEIEGAETDRVQEPG